MGLLADGNLVATQRLVAEARAGVIRVVLADDHKLFRTGVRRLLETERDIEVVGEADDGLAVQRLVDEFSPDVVLMDVTMDVVDGISATREISRRWPSTKVVIVSMHGQDGHLFQALQAGAVGYVLKTAGSGELLAAVRAAASGGAVIAPKLATKLLSEFRRMSTKLGVEDGLGQLSDIEMQMLQLVASGLSNREIANRLGFAESTVKNRLSTMFQTLGVADRTQAAVYAITRGLVPIERAEAPAEAEADERAGR